jgi:hypothetical protein
MIKWLITAAGVVLAALLLTLTGVVEPEAAPAVSTAAPALGVQETIDALCGHCPGWPDCPTQEPLPPPSCLSASPQPTCPPQPTSGPNPSPTGSPPIGGTRTPTPTPSPVPTRQVDRLASALGRPLSATRHNVYLPLVTLPEHTSTPTPTATFTPESTVTPTATALATPTRQPTNTPAPHPAAIHGVVRTSRSDWGIIKTELGAQVVEMLVTPSTADAEILAGLDDAQRMGLSVLLHVHDRGQPTDVPWSPGVGVTPRGAEILRLVEGHPALWAVYMFEEPFDYTSSGHVTPDEQRELYAAIKAVAADVPLYSDMSTIYRAEREGLSLSDGMCDICCVAPGWPDDPIARLNAEVSTWQRLMPNSQLAVMVNVYDDGSSYVMPTAEQIRNFRSELCALDLPYLYYPWQQGSYDLTLADVPHLWPVVAEGCGEGPPPPTDTPAPPPTDTPAPPPTDTPAPPPTDTPAPPPPTNTPEPSGGIVIDHRHVDAGELSLAELDAARQVAAYFNHASIGGNILDGMRDLQSQNAARYSISIQFSSGTGAGINEYQAGSNGRPMTKIDGFASNIRDGHDAAFLKFCTGDVPCVNGDTPIETMWTRYRDMMAAQQSQHPDTVLVWWTIPIIARDHSRAQCDQELGWFNGQVRQYVRDHGLMLFDLADIESHDPSGDPVTTSQGYEAAWPGYTSDGAHLNETGRQRVANAVWHLLAEIARE